jgi:hypothetical protein
VTLWNLWVNGNIEEEIAPYHLLKGKDFLPGACRVALAKARFQDTL